VALDKRVLGFAPLAMCALLASGPPPISVTVACGSDADRVAVEAAAVARFHKEGLKLDSTRLEHLIVVRDWARVDVEFKGSYREWFHNVHGRWTFASRGVRPSMPLAVARALDVVAGPIPDLCRGPHYRNHPSGP
jgi:hypothetical protein